MTVSLVQVRACSGSYRAQIGSGKLATTGNSTRSAESAARRAFAARVGLDPFSQTATDSITVSLVVSSASSGADLYLCELVPSESPDNPHSEIRIPHSAISWEGCLMPSVDLSPTDDLREWLEFYGTAVDRLGTSLLAVEQALARGEIGSALYYVRNAKVTHSILAKGIAKARAELIRQ